MRVLIIGFFSKTYMPYIKKYEDKLKEKNIEYDIIEFDRDTNNKTQKCGNSYIFSHKTSTNKIQMLWLSIKYRRLILKVMKNKKYDKLIILTSMPAVLICNRLFKKYQNQYIFDYRDYTYEKIPIYRKILDRVIKNSDFTVMSSKGYIKYFENKDKIYITHNISNIEDMEKDCIDLKKCQKINIGFLGYVRYFDVNSKLIETFKNSTKISFKYIGTPFADCDLEGFCEANNIKNVDFYGKYDNSQKANLYKDIQIINSIYSLDSSEVMPAIPNRLYDAALFKKPILVARGTYLAEIVEKYKLGIVLDVFNDDIKNIINNYITNFNVDEFVRNCSKFLEEVFRDESVCEKKISHFLLKNKE